MHEALTGKISSTTAIAQLLMLTRPPGAVVTLRPVDIIVTSRFSKRAEMLGRWPPLIPPARLSPPPRSSAAGPPLHCCHATNSVSSDSRAGGSVYLLRSALFAVY